MNLNFKLFSKKQAKETFKKEKDPARDWKLIIIVFLVLNVTALSGSGYMFWIVNSGSLFKSSGHEPLIKELNTKDLARIIDEFGKKEILHATHSAEKPTVQDPSL